MSVDQPSRVVAPEPPTNASGDTAREASPTNVTRRLGPFDLHEKLGSGGMGAVYRATYRKNGRVVALKVLTADLTDNPKVLTRFEREMEILEKLDHPNITRYYGGGCSGDQYFYAMRLMRGGSIDRLLKKSGPMPWERVVEFGMQICDALDHAHEQGVIHRDLKPANLFLRSEKSTGQERLVLGDFGIARDAAASGLTATGMTVGTYAYMSPEQIKSPTQMTGRSDLYSLGCVLFEMLTGRPPFHYDTPGEIMAAHLQETPPSLRELAPDTPIWLAEVISRLLARNPADRPMDAAAAKLALEEVIENESQSVSVATHVGSGEPTQISLHEVHPGLRQLLRRKKKKKKRKGPSSPLESTWLLLAGLAAIIGLFAWALWPASESDLFAQAQLLMQSDDPVQHSDAVKMYLHPMLERFPNGEHAAEARAFIDQFRARRLMRRIQNSARLGIEPQSESERLFREAWRFEQFGDRVTALDKYRSLATLLEDRPSEQDFLMLARMQITEIESNADNLLSRVDLLNSSLARADDFLTNGRRVEAEAIWNSVISLYGGNQEFDQQVRYARARLSGMSTDDIEFVPAATPESD